MFTDDDRRTLYNALEGSIGHDPAAILMAHLPPSGWGELATRSDVVELRAELRGEMAEVRGEMAEVRGEIAQLRARIDAQLPRLIAANVASMVGVAGLVPAAALVA